MMNKKLKLIFAGTPKFSVPTLNQLHQEGYEISLILTQPDRKSGRGMALKPSAVKQKAIELGLPVFQPHKLNDQDVFQKIKAENADILIVAAYGLIIPSNILNIFNKGSYNVHASLLPSWRGAAPIHRAIEFGDKEIGVTIMSVIPRLDAGDMVRRKSVALDKDANTGDMTNLIANLGAELMVAVINDLNDDKQLKLIKQNEKMVTYANKINKIEAKIIWKEVTSKIIVQKINAFNPFPGVFCIFRGKIVKIWQAQISKNLEMIKPGEVAVNSQKDIIVVGTKDGCIEVNEIQLEGKRRMNAKEFISANNVNGGEIFL
jgi:methionyl-tRNA formyltransferase